MFFTLSYSWFDGVEICCIAYLLVNKIKFSPLCCVNDDSLIPMLIINWNYLTKNDTLHFNDSCRNSHDSIYKISSLPSQISQYLLVVVVYLITYSF